MEKIKKRRFCRVAGLAALLAFAGIASADSLITVPGVDWSRGESIWINENSAPVDAYFAGVIYIDLTQNGQDYQRDTLCVDLFTDIYLWQTYGNQVLDPSAVPGRGLERVAWLIDNAMLPPQNPLASTVMDPSEWVTTPAQGAGIQLAIWDITTDGGDGLSAGSVQASSDPNNPTPADVINWANYYESASVGQASDAAFVYLNWNTSNLSPAQMLEGPMFLDNGPAPAPEPVPYLLVGTSLLGLGLMTRRMRTVR